MNNIIFLKNDLGFLKKINELGNFEEIIENIDYERDLKSFDKEGRDILPKASFIFYELNGSYEDNSHMREVQELRSPTSILLLVLDSKNIKEDAMRRVIELNESNRSVLILDLSMNKDLLIPTLNFIKYQLKSKKENEELTKEDLIKLNKELEHLFYNVQNDLERLRKVYSQITPQRFKNITGINVSYKYSAGESSGGEFFDVSEKDNNILILLSSSNSYVVTSTVLANFSMLQQLEKFNLKSIKGMLSGIVGELESFGQQGNGPSNLNLELLVGYINIRKLTFEGYNFGSSLVHSNKKLNIPTNEYPVNQKFLDEAYFCSKIERDERIVLISPGARKNFDKLASSGASLDAVLRGNSDSTDKDIVNNFFYELKKDKKVDFLKYDASVILLRVGQNVIASV